MLESHGIPHWVAGGLAAQEHGYRRNTDDVDIIVPCVAEAKEVLRANGFRQNPKARDSVIETATGIVVDLLPGGGKVIGHEPLNLPMPAQVSNKPQVLPLIDFVNAKLSSGRHKDETDVIELIKIRSLPRDLPLDEAVRSNFERVWDLAAAEQAAQAVLNARGS